MSIVSFNNLMSDEASQLRSTTAPSSSEEQARSAATKFEALLLTQLTSALGPSSLDDEDGMFRSDAGDLYRQMFSEQMASLMANNGGIGLSKTIMAQINKRLGTAPKVAANGNERALSAMREIKSSAGEERPQNISNAARPKAAIARNQPSARIDNRMKFDEADSNVRTPETTLPANSSLDPVIISTANSENRPDNYPETFVNVRLVPTSNEVTTSTRPRRVFPALPVETTPVAADAPLNVPAETISPSRSTEPVTFRMPVRGVFRSNFGMRRDPINGKPRNHLGIDIAAPMGTPIGAVASGKVIFAGRQRGYGNCVILEHPDGRQTRYAHAQRLMVEVGQTVQAGEVIALVGSTGRSTGPHLHFEVMENGRRLDPLKFLPNAFTSARR
jgi:murein DD-endopeptidase MepM/ murein hydrolase activator NlpD